MITAAALRAALEQLPAADAGAITDGGRALILAPHPDDETLGCGGLIAECCVRFTPPFVVILTDGAASHPDSITHAAPRLAQLRRAEAQAAVALLGLPPDHLLFLDYPDARLPRAGALVERIAGLIGEHDCAIVLAPMPTDPHCDHVSAAAIAAAAAARTGARLLYYPVWTWLLAGETALDIPAPAGWRLDITDHVAAKQRAIAAHASQYTGLIADQPDGFRLPAELLAIFARRFEIFIEG